MSANHIHQQDGSNLPVPADRIESRSPSLSESTKYSSDSRRHSRLDIPPHRRPSLDSIYSDISELSFHTNELHTNNPLIRRTSHDAIPVQPAQPRSRLWRALHSFYVANYGAMLVLLSQAFGAGMNISARLLETNGPHGEGMHPFQILFARQFITALVCTSYGIWSKSIPHFPFGPAGVRWLLIIRGVSGFFGVFGMYFSLMYLPLSEATVMTFLTPILTCYLCSFVIPGETFSRQQQLAGLVSLLGVVFIANPISMAVSAGAQPPAASDPTEQSPELENDIYPTTSQHLMAIGIAMLGVIGATGALTSIRAIGTRAHPFLSINYFSVWCTIVSLMCLIIFPDVKFRLPGNITEWGLLLSLGFCGFIMQFLLTSGLAYGGPQEPTQRIRDVEAHNTSVPASRDASPHDESAESQRQLSLAPPKAKASGTRATSMVYTQMLFALAGDKLVFGTSPGVMSWIGSGLVLAGAIWVASARDKTSKNITTDGSASVMEPSVTSARGKTEGAVAREEMVGLMNDIDDENDERMSGQTARESVELHHFRRNGQEWSFNQPSRI